MPWSLWWPSWLLALSAADTVDATVGTVVTLIVVQVAVVSAGVSDVIVVSAGGKTPNQTLGSHLWRSHGLV